MSYSLDLPAETMADLRSAARDATISLARTFGFGGSFWGAEVPSGSGTGPKAMQPAGVVHGLAFRQRPAGTAPVGGDTPVLGDAWRMIVISGNVRPSMVVTSMADPRYVFDVGTVEPWFEYIRCNLERRR